MNVLVDVYGCAATLASRSQCSLHNTPTSHTYFEVYRRGKYHATLPHFMSCPRSICGVGSRKLLYRVSGRLDGGFRCGRWGKSKFNQPWRPTGCPNGILFAEPTRSYPLPGFYMLAGKSSVSMESDFRGENRPLSRLKRLDAQPPHRLKYNEGSYGLLSCLQEKHISSILRCKDPNLRCPGQRGIMGAWKGGVQADRTKTRLAHYSLHRNHYQLSLKKF